MRCYGFRLAIRNEKIDYSGEEKIFVVPKKTLVRVLKLSAGEDGKISMSIGKRHITFKEGDYDIVSHLFDEEVYKNDKAAIPELPREL